MHAVFKLVLEEAPNVSRNPNEPTIIEDETPQNAQATPSNLDDSLAAVQATIEKLQRLKDPQDQVDRLKSGVLGRSHDDLPPIPYRDPFQSSGRDQEIKLKNLPTFTLDYTLQKRQEWLLDLQQMFEGAPKKYHDNRT
ncbi:hypothetical protein F1880_008464 [Penicillium rolfsii]|nr:hypothetical protein F1880_008464 [Penicillium rolfsii]